VAGEILVQMVGGDDEFGRRVGPLGKQDAVLHVAVTGDEDQQDAFLGQADEFHLPEIKLVRELKDAYSVLDRFPHGKKRFIAAIRSAILTRFLASNVVYHGLVGHYFVSSISHVLKVRIISDIESRVTGEMARENISEEKARYILKKDDEERRKWGMFLYGLDIVAPENYNLLIRIGHLNEDEVVDLCVLFPDTKRALRCGFHLDWFGDEPASYLIDVEIGNEVDASISSWEGHLKAGQ
jgi:hypothetical protein